MKRFSIGEFSINAELHVLQMKIFVDQLTINCASLNKSACKFVFYTIMSVDLDDEFLLLIFGAFCVTLMKRNVTGCHMFVCLEVVRQVKVSSDWFGCIFVVSFNLL